MQSGFLLPLTPVARCIQNKPLIRQVFEDLRGAGYRFMGRIQRPVKCLFKGLPIRIDPKPGKDAVPADLPELAQRQLPCLDLLPETGIHLLKRVKQRP